MNGGNKMKQKWKTIIKKTLIMISILFIEIVAVYIYKIATYYPYEVVDNVITTGDQGYREYQKEYIKRIRVLKSAAYEKGIQDYNQGVEKKDRGFDYPEEAKEMIKKLPASNSEGNTRVIYDDFYEKGYQDAQKKKAQ